MLSNDAAQISSARNFMGGGSGKWAGEQFLRAAAQGQNLSPSVLRTLETLRHEEWIEFDRAVVEGAQMRLRAVAALVERGLTRTISNGLGKTILHYQKMSDMDEASVSLDGVTRAMNDGVEFSDGMLPLPITHKDWYLNLRHLTASRSTGESLDTTYARLAGRKCGEMTEYMLLHGGKVFGGVTIYGLLNHPDRNTTSFGTNGNWGQSAKTGENIVADVLRGISILEQDRQFGPYGIFVGSDASPKLQEDYKSFSDRTIKDRILSLDNVSFVEVTDQMPSANVVIVQLTPDTVQMIEGEPLQNVQWDVHGGFQINFKAFQILVPLVRSDSEGRSGIVHFTS